MAIYSDVNYIKPSLGGKVEDINSVYQAIFTLLGTKKSERLFRPNYGASLETYLFDPCDEITARSILYDLQSTIGAEPRVKLNTSKTSVTPVPEENLFLINLVFTVLGFSDVERTLSLTLKQDE